MLLFIYCFIKSDIILLLIQIFKFEFSRPPLNKTKKVPFHNYNKTVSISKFSRKITIILKISSS